MDTCLKGILASLIFFSFTIIFVNGQNNLDFKTQVSLPDSYDGLILSPAASLEFKKHSWSIGPTFLISYGDQIAERETIKVSGLYIGYDNYLHGKDEKLNFFFAVDLYLQRIKDIQASQYFDTQSNSFQAFEIEQMDNIVQLFVNYGISLKLTEKLHLSQSIGVGVNNTLRSTSSPFNDFSDSFFSKDWLLKTGINYRFK